MRSRSKRASCVPMRSSHQRKPLLLHRVPVVERIAPELTVGVEVVGRHAGNRERLAARVEREQIALPPNVDAVAIDVERQVAEEIDAALVRVTLQRGPLQLEQILLEHERAKLLAARGESTRAALRRAVAVRRRAIATRRSSKRALKSSNNPYGTSQRRCARTNSRERALLLRGRERRERRVARARDRRPHRCRRAARRQSRDPPASMKRGSPACAERKQYGEPYASVTPSGSVCQTLNPPAASQSTNRHASAPSVPRASGPGSEVGWSNTPARRAANRIHAAALRRLRRKPASMRARHEHDALVRDVEMLPIRLASRPMTLPCGMLQPSSMIAFAM